MCYGMWFPVSHRKKHLFEEGNILARGVLVVQHPEAKAAHHCQMHRAGTEEVSDFKLLKETRNLDIHRRSE